MQITLRGTVLEAADAADQDHFGASISLSSDGLVLVIGADQRNNAGTDQGAVYTYDWSGSAWVQRGSVLVAGDAADNEYFGCSVALSSDGLVLAVGSRAWFSATNGSVGGVYIYDKSGSSWVQRGSVIEPSYLVTSGMSFGWAVALSGDGSRLVVGAPLTNYTYTQQGRTYYYDWSGSAWTEGWIDIDYPSLYDYFGASVAISSNGLVVAIGCKLWDGTVSNQGAVFVYDNPGWYVRSGTAPVVAPDAAANDSFGQAVALSADGSQMLVLSTRWDGTFTMQGRIYDFRWAAGSWTTPDPEIVPTVAGDYFTSIALSPDSSVFAVGMPGRAHTGGTLTGTGGVYIYDAGPPVLTGKAVAPTLLTIVYATGKAVAPTELTITASGKAVAPTSLAVVDLSQHWPIWSLRCTIDGVDVSARLKGVAEVEAEEGAARIARFTIAPTSGVIAPLDYVGRVVTLDYLQTIAGTEVARRVFTGRIDTPSFDDAEILLTFECVDDLQNKVAALDRSVIDALCNGRYSTAVQGELLDNWDYAGAVMSTVAGSLDAGPFANIRVTPWELASTWATFTDANLIYARSRMSFPQRSTLVNRVAIEYEYRYPRLRQRYAYTSWGGTLLDMAPNGYAYPTQADILSAAGGSGWEVLTGVFYSAPASIAHSSGGFIYPADDAVDLAILQMAQRHSQTVTETYSLVVSAPESIDANGALPHALRGALQSDFDGGAWESAFDVAPLMPTGGDMDWAPDAPRADSDHAIETLLDQARVIILGSHRGARVGNATVCNPDLDLDKKVAISTAMRTASGKVARVLHSFDLQAGSAVTEFEIACFGVGGAGIITPDTLAAPTPPAEAAETQAWLGQLPALSVNTYGVTPYQDTLMGLLLNTPETITVSDVPTVDGPKTLTYANPFYSVGEYPVTGFRMEMPGVVDADRNPIELAVTGDYSIVVPTDTLTTTIP